MKKGGKQTQQNTVCVPEIHKGTGWWLGVVVPLAIATFIFGLVLEAQFGVFDRGLVPAAQTVLEGNEMHHHNDVMEEEGTFPLSINGELADEQRPQDSAPRMLIAEGSGTLPIFSEPSVEGRVVTEVSASEEYPYVMKVGDWYQFYFEDDLKAWIQAIYVVPIE